MQGEKGLLIDPSLARDPAAFRRHRLEARNRVFIGVLRVYGLTGTELERPRCNEGTMSALGSQVHFDTAFSFVVKRGMAEQVWIECPFELAVDPGEEVPVEGGGHALRVIISWNEDIQGLLQVGTDQEDGIPSEKRPRRAQKRLSFQAGEVADGRTWKKSRAGPASKGSLICAGS